MCQIKSMIVLKNRIYNPYDHDHHSKMLEELNIRDDNSSPNFVRVEMVPKDGDLFNHARDNWTFKVEQELLPDWFDEREAEEACWNELQEWFADRFIQEGMRITSRGVWYALDDATVEAHGNATVYARDDATVRACGNATVRACGDVTVYAHGNASVYARDSAIVEAYDSASFEELEGNAIIRDYRGGDFKLIVPEGVEVVKFGEQESESVETWTPAEGEVFWHLTAILTPRVDENCGCGFTAECINVGNYFKTREECEAAVERVKKAIREAKEG